MRPPIPMYMWLSFRVGNEVVGTTDHVPLAGARQNDH
jgi:hypothetical protein